MKEKTHYRKAFNSPYLSSADIVEATTLTVSHVTLSPDLTKKTKDMFNTAHFKEKHIRPGEPLKPMILNATNSATMKKLTGSPYIDDWQDVRITVYVDSAVRFGRDTVEGLRISTKPPEPPIPMATSEQMEIIDGLELSIAQNQWVEQNKPLNANQAAALIKKVSV